MQAMAASKKNAARGEMRTITRWLVIVGRRFGRHVARLGIVCGRLGDVTPVDLRVWQIDAAPDRLFLDGTDRKMRRQKAPLDVGVVGDRGGRAGLLLLEIGMKCPLLVRGR